MDKIVVISPNWLGDAVMSLPLLGYLGASPVRLAVLSPRYTARVYLGLDVVDELVVFERKKGIGRVLHAARLLRALDARAVILLPPSFSSALAAFLSRAESRVGYDTDGRGALLSRPLQAKSTRDEHLSQNYIALGEAALEGLGLEGPASYTAPRPVVFPREREELDRILERKGFPGGDFVVVVPGATYGEAKRWPPASFRALIEKLSAEVPVLLSGTGQERESAARLADGLHGVFDLCGETEQGTLLSLLERASLVIANDSGTPHLSAALGTPTIVLFGSTSPVWTAPLGDQVRIIRRPVDCSPCYMSTCPGNLECFRAIEPDEVLEKARAALRKSSIKSI